MKEEILKKLETLAITLLDQTIDAAKRPSGRQIGQQVREALDVVDTYIDLRDGRRNYTPSINISVGASAEEIKEAISGNLKEAETSK